MFILAVMPGCGGKPPLTPLETFDAYNRAWQERNFERMWELVGQTYKDEYEQRVARLKETIQSGWKIKMPVPVPPEKLKTMSGREFYVFMKQLAAKPREETDEYVFTVEDYSSFTHYNDDKIKDEELENRATLYFKNQQNTVVSVVLIREDDNVWRIHKFPE